MVRPEFLPLVLKQTFRRPVRALLTIAGVATAMFLFAAVAALQNGVDAATRQTAEDVNLVVYRQNRFCPAASRLPESYGERIARIDGVTSVLPMQVVPTSCRASLDVITFRGVPADLMSRTYGTELTLLSGSLAEWASRKDAALLGDVIALRRGLKAGDRVDAAGVTVYVAGVLRAEHPQQYNAAYVHLDFLQRTTGQRTLGVVTQFNVKVADPSRLDAVAEQIDAMFKDDQQPTHTSPEKGFVARAAADIIILVRFTRYLGWGCLASVLALVGNAIVLNVQDRIRDHAVFQTLGFGNGLIARLIVVEALVLGLLGGLLGTVLALAVAHWGRFSVSSEGLTIPVQATAGVLLRGVAVAVALGVAAGLVPAWQASRRPITECLRTV